MLHFCEAVCIQNQQILIISEERRQWISTCFIRKTGVCYILSLYSQNKKEVPLYQLSSEILHCYLSSAIEQKDPMSFGSDCAIQYFGDIIRTCNSMEAQGVHNLLPNCNHFWEKNFQQQLVQTGNNQGKSSRKKGSFTSSTAMENKGRHSRMNIF